MSPPSQHEKPARALRQLSAPRAAGLAGVVFAVLFATVLILIRTRMPEGGQDSTDWVESQRSAITTATALMPFVGISFLWFTGVVRDGFGRYEDRFFLSVFLGSGLLFLAMMFVATAVAAGLVASHSGATDPGAHAELMNFGKRVMLSATKTYALRMAAVFMITLATIWLKTRVMPRWLAVMSYLLAVGLLIAADTSMWLALAFPAWVLVVSGLILARSGLLAQLHTPGAID